VRPGQIIGVTAATAHVRREPGKISVGRLLRGDRFHVDRVHRVRSGPAKGLWYHGTGSATGIRARPVKVTGWVRASAFS
jgi:hypothetical protein